MKSFFIIYASIILFAQLSWGGVRLPLLTLRDQGNSLHCWAYSMSHLLESRALIRDSQKILINVEKDIMYWVDYDRMWFIYETKGDVYLNVDEGAWQIEYWESLLKHGKFISSVEVAEPSLLYNYPDAFKGGLPFMEEPRPTPDPTLMSFVEAKDYLRTLENDDVARAFIVDFLDRYYGKPVTITEWLDQKNMSISEVSSKILGSDFSDNHEIESVVLIKPTSDGNFGWVKYLYNRYWGYRYDETKILELVETSLDRHWPVTFDNVYHAMTIIGYEKTAEGTFYAIVDSDPAQISWYSEKDLRKQLNLVTFFKSTIADKLPPRSNRNMFVKKSGKELDRYDHVEIPPR